MEFEGFLKAKSLTIHGSAGMESLDVLSGEALFGRVGLSNGAIRLFGESSTVDTVQLKNSDVTGMFFLRICVHAIFCLCV